MGGITFNGESDCLAFVVEHIPNPNFGLLSDMVILLQKLKIKIPTGRKQTSQGDAGEVGQDRGGNHRFLLRHGTERIESGNGGYAVFSPPGDVVVGYTPASVATLWRVRFPYSLPVRLSNLCSDGSKRHGPRSLLETAPTHKRRPCDSAEFGVTPDPVRIDGTHLRYSDGGRAITTVMFGARNARIALAARSRPCGSGGPTRS
jgi:hypothetical protein